MCERKIIFINMYIISTKTAADITLKHIAVKLINPKQNKQAETILTISIPTS